MAAKNRAKKQEALRKVTENLARYDAHTRIHFLVTHLTMQLHLRHKKAFLIRICVCPASWPLVLIHQCLLCICFNMLQ